MIRKLTIKEYNSEFSYYEMIVLTDDEKAALEFTPLATKKEIETENFGPAGEFYRGSRVSFHFAVPDDENGTPCYILPRGLCDYRDDKGIFYEMAKEMNFVGPEVVWLHLEKYLQGEVDASKRPLDW